MRNSPANASSSLTSTSDQMERSAPVADLTPRDCFMKASFMPLRLPRITLGAGGRRDRDFCNGLRRKALTLIEAAFETSPARHSHKETL